MSFSTLYALCVAIIFPNLALANGGAFDVMSLLPIVLIFVVFYFLLLRPQQQKMKAHQNLLNNLRRGDRVVTAGGIVGVVQKTSDNDVILEIADNVRVTVVKQMIQQVMSLPSQNNGQAANTSREKNASKGGAKESAKSKSSENSVEKNTDKNTDKNADKNASEALDKNGEKLSVDAE